MTAVHALPRRHLDRDVYSLALERMAYAMDTFDHLAVSFSGGKDSTAVLQVALEVAHSSPRYRRHLPLRACFFDEECIPYETEQYVRRISQRDDVAMEWYCLPVRHRNACSRTSPWWWPWAPEDRDRWARPLPPEAITELPGFQVWPQQARTSVPDSNKLLAPPQLGNVGMLMGIRAQESPTRKRAVSLPGREKNYIVKINNNSAQGTSYGNLWKVYPIYDWQTVDVWTAPRVKGWDYNRAYDLMEMAGISAHSQRCSPAFGEEPLQKLWVFATCFPDVWERMTERVPGVGAAHRYALTELYGYGGRPAKPAGTPWQDFLLRYLRQHRPDSAEHIAARLTDIIRRHYRQTTHPIAPKAMHPDSGVSWDFLLTVAMRGDFKERKQPKHRTRSDDSWQIPAWARYTGELQQVLDGGRFGELCHPGRPPAAAADLIPDRYRSAVATADPDPEPELPVDPELTEPDVTEV